MLGDTNATPYVHADFIVDPNFCPLEYSYDISKLTNATPDSAIMQTDKTFNFSYLVSRAPLF